MNHIYAIRCVARLTCKDKTGQDNIGTDSHWAIDVWFKKLDPNAHIDATKLLSKHRG